MNPAESGKSLRKSVFRVLSGINQTVLPRYSKKDLNRLSSLDKLIIAWRYYVTRNSLD